MQTYLYHVIQLFLNAVSVSGMIDEDQVFESLFCYILDADIKDSAIVKAYRKINIWIPLQVIYFLGLINISVKTSSYTVSPALYLHEVPPAPLSA